MHQFSQMQFKGTFLSASNLANWRDNYVQTKIDQLSFRFQFAEKC